MKKTRKALAVITSLVMFACASLATMSTDAAIVTDNTRSEFDSVEETVDVRILFNYDAKILDKVKGEAHQKAEELSKEYYDSLDVLKYTELERLSMQREYFNVNYERLSKELTEKAKKDLAKPILEDIGVDITEDIEYPNYGFILCELNKDQLSKAEKNDIIKSVSVDKDWDNENYIGTPSIYPVLTGTTSTYVNTTYTTTTTSVSVTPSLVTTLEYYGNDMFTDIIKDIDEFTIQFENHGKYRFLSSAIKDQLIHYKIGDEITIRFEYLRVNDTDTPRIDNILMLKCTNIPLGDVNRDRLIDAIDASIILANYAKYSTSSDKPAESELAVQDVNGDGFIDAVDASSVLTYYAYVSVGGNLSFSEYLNDPKAAITTTTAVTTTTVITTITTTKVTAKLSGELIPIPNDRTDMPVIRGISLAGSLYGSEEFNSKKPSRSGIRCIFGLEEEIIATLDTDTKSGIIMYIFNHKDDQSYYETANYSMPIAYVVASLKDGVIITSIGDGDGGDDRGYYDMVFVYDGTAFAKLYIRVYYNELINKSDAELEQLMHEQSSEDLLGKTFVYENSSSFTITFNDYGKFACYEKDTLSYMTIGKWELNGDTVVLKYPFDENSEKTVYLKLNGSDMVYIGDRSDNFTSVKVQDGDKFSDTGIRNKVDWYTDFHNDVNLNADWKNSNKNISAIIKDTDGLKSYLEQFCHEKVMNSYLEKYSDSFFENNVLLMRWIFQGAGSDGPKYMVNVILPSSGSLGAFIMYNGNQNGDDEASVCLAQVIVPKEYFNDDKGADWVGYNVTI